jgi:uncharacterized membrane protein YbaN (DUF454 family)
MVRAILYLAGWISVALAIAGAFLPLLPSTPFALLAAACFARSSPRAMQRLRSSPLLGPVLRDWEQHRGIRLSAKLTAGCLTVSAPLLTYVLRPGFSLPLCISLAGACVALILICRLKTVRPVASVVPAPHTRRNKQPAQDKVPLAA